MLIFGGPGVFGSVSRNRAYKETDVDIFIVLKELGLTGESIDLVKVCTLSLNNYTFYSDSF